MELCKTDLLKLLTYLEGELQAREIVIATLKAERVKQLLYQAKYGQFSLNDPFAALQRDSYGAYNPNCDEAAIKAMYNNQLSQVENLILQHRRAQQRLRQHLYDAEQQHGKVVSELEEEIRKHAQDTAQGDDVTYMLEKERERLHQEVELERQQNKKLERELKKVVQALEQDKLRHKQIVMLLLEERKRIVAKLVDEHSKNEEMSEFLSLEKERMTDVVEGLEEESQKSLQMEADLEQQAAEFSREREHLKSCLRKETEKNKQLIDQIELLKRELSDHPRYSSMCQLQSGDSGSIVHHSEALLTVNVGTDDNEFTSDVDSNVESDAALRMVPTVREMTNASSFTSVVVGTSNIVNGNTVPTNPSHCTDNANSSVLSIKPSTIRSGSDTASCLSTSTTSTLPTRPMAISLDESSPKLVTPRLLKTISPAPSSSLGSDMPSPNSTTIVKVMHAVTPSPSSSPSPSTSSLLALASTQHQTTPTSNVPSSAPLPTAEQEQHHQQPSKNKESVMHSVVVSTPPSPVTSTNATTTISPSSSPHVVQVTPRVNMSATSGARVFTTTQGGKVTFHVTAPQPPKKPPQLGAASTTNVGSSSVVSVVGSVGRGAPPPVPPNKPILLKKGDVASAAVATGAGSTTKTPSSIRFGITISKSDGAGSSSVCTNSSSGGSHVALSSLPSSSGGPTVITATSIPNQPGSHGSNNATSPMFKETQPVMLMACSTPSTSSLSPPPELMTMSTSSGTCTRNLTLDLNDDDEDNSLAPELADFQQLLVSMATTSIGSDYSSTVTSSVAVSSSMSDVPPQRNSSSPVGRLSAMLDGWKLTPDGTANDCAVVDGNDLSIKSPPSYKDKLVGGGGGNGGGCSRNRSSIEDRLSVSSPGHGVGPTSTTSVGRHRGVGGIGGGYVRNGNFPSGGGGNASTSNRKSSTTGFKPCVRKVVSPTHPKSFNHLDL